MQPCRKDTLVPRASQRSSAAVVHVWKVGSPHQGDTPASSIPPLLNAEALRLGFALEVPLSTHTFTGSEAAGAYTWYALLVRPGLNPAQSANWLSIDSTPFTFTP